MPQTTSAVVAVAIVLWLQLLFASIERRKHVELCGINGFVKTFFLTLALRSNKILAYHLMTFFFVLHKAPKFESWVHGFSAAQKKLIYFVPLEAEHWNIIFYN